MIGEVDFIDRFMRGENADEIMQIAANELVTDLSSRTNELVQSRVQARHTLAVEVEAITRQIEAPFLEVELEAIERAKAAVEELAAEQKKLKARVQRDRGLVQHNRQLVTVLQKHLVELQQMLAILSQTPSYYEKKIKELGQRMSGTV